MSDQQPRRPNRPTGSGCATALMVVFGIILLLPGLCSLIFSVGFLVQGGGLGGDAGILSLIAFGLLLGGFGVTFIVMAIRR